MCSKRLWAVEGTRLPCAPFPRLASLSVPALCIVAAADQCVGGDALADGGLAAFGG